MSLKTALLAEFDHEMATTRSLLERVPEGAAGWRPHPRSFTLGQLAMHVATLPGLGMQIMDKPEFDMNPAVGEGYRLPDFESTAALLETFDAAVRGARAALEQTDDAALQVVWILKNAGETLVSRPRAAAYRIIFMSHLIHHRGQLSVYLRLQDVPLPFIYGPTADMQVA
jgi:uncharacterized damage-inducible protein DinB